MNYVQVTESNRRQMLEHIGVDSVDQLFCSLPAEYRLDHLLDLPPGKSELQLQSELARRGQSNRPAAAGACFLGGGAYDHFIPAVVDAMAGKGEFVTAYTPYQAEASQGSLQAFFEFQTQIARLTGLDIANASLYEGATAVAEAALLAVNVTGRNRLIVAATLHPHHRQVLRTYMSDLPVELTELPHTAGRTDPASLAAWLDDNTAGVIVQSPNVFGQIEPWAELFARTHEIDKALAIAVFNPIACGLLRRPGQCGGDIGVGEGQPLGIPLQFGGPYVGLFAARQALMRKMPGRLVGRTTDAQGRTGYCLTLQTREQHIRGAKATSNICTNQGLLALRATIYMTAMGPHGLREVAEQCYHKAHHAAATIGGLDGYSLAYDGPFFHEFVVNCPVEAARIIEAGREQGIAPGLDCAGLGIGESNQLLIAVTEK